MRFAHVPLAVLLGSLLVLAPALQANAQTPAVPPTKVLPNVNLQGVTVEAMADYLRDADPSVQVIVVRDPDAPADQPNINLKLKNVTVTDVLKILPVAFPGIELVPATDSPIVILKVHAIPGAVAVAQVVRVYSLYAGVQALEEINGTGSDKALNDALSLIQASLNQTPQNPAPVIQVHQATMSLIVKATADQQETVIAAIKALQAAAAPPTATRPSGDR